MLTPLVKGAIDLALPPGCMICGSPGTDFICTACWRRLRSPMTFVCLKCGSPGSIPNFLCRDCLHAARHFDRARAAFPLIGECRDLVYRFKFQGQRFLSESLGAAMARVASVMLPRPDLVAAVPLHPERAAQRGFNQAEDLAAAVGRLLGVPFEGRAVSRIRNTEPLSGMGPSARREELKGAFEAGPPAGRGLRRVLLVDDIYTTGATADACAAVLKDEWGVRVDVIVAARSSTFDRRSR